jgi:ferredoxin-fold anticodon binding domain-containing protein
MNPLYNEYIGNKAKSPKIREKEMMIMKKSIYFDVEVTYMWANGSVHLGKVKSVGPKWVSLLNSETGKIDWVVPANVDLKTEEEIMASEAPGNGQGERQRALKAKAKKVA